MTAPATVTIVVSDMDRAVAGSRSAYDRLVMERLEAAGADISAARVVCTSNPMVKGWTYTAPAVQPRKHFDVCDLAARL